MGAEHLQVGQVDLLALKENQAWPFHPLQQAPNFQELRLASACLGDRRGHRERQEMVRVRQSKVRRGLVGDHCHHSDLRVDVSEPQSKGWCTSVITRLLNVSCGLSHTSLSSRAEAVKTLLPQEN